MNTTLAPLLRNFNDMRLLLDTHTMDWYIEGDPQLSATSCILIPVLLAMIQKCGQNLMRHVDLITDSSWNSFSIFGCAFASVTGIS